MLIPQKQQIPEINEKVPFLTLQGISPPHIPHKLDKSGSNAKQKYNAKFPGVNFDYYTSITKTILTLCYPKICPKCSTTLSVEIPSRETSVRCPKCHYMGSRTSLTPLDNFRLPLWTFGYILSEAVTMFPQPLSSSMIRRKLLCPKNTATLLKRRLQLFLSEFIDPIKDIMNDELSKNDKLPVDLTNVFNTHKVASLDTVALFSAGTRSNGYRARYKHNGQTSSIYLTDSVALEKGKYQIGTLVHTVAFKKGPVIFDSVPDQRQKTLHPLLSFIPDNAPIFSDEGYPWLKHYNDNHRAINHSKRAKDKKRNVYSRERWCSNGVHNQVAEGNQRLLKYTFTASYSYIKPEYSQLYLNEFSALKAITLYGIDYLNSKRKNPPQVPEKDVRTIGRE